MEYVITQGQPASAPANLRGPRWQLGVAVAGLLISLGAAATDYSQLSTGELAAMRGRLGELSDQERNQFYKEMRARMNGMSIGERMRLMQDTGNAGGSGEAARRHYGTGAGSPGFGYGYEKRQRQQGAGRDR